MHCCGHYIEQDLRIWLNETESSITLEGPTYAEDYAHLPASIASQELVAVYTMPDFTGLWDVEMGKCL
jgi:hypothetical protein